jgi:DNA-binding response OmpR family regulator
LTTRANLRSPIRFHPSSAQLLLIKAGVKSQLHSEPSAQPLNTLELKAILLVDDDKQLAAALQWILADENFLVDVAFDGEEAMIKIKAHEYDAVICDLMMPRVRGDQFYLNALWMRPHLFGRFIFITGFATDPKISQFLTENEVKYLVKPFPVEGLISCVKELFSGR